MARGVECVWALLLNLVWQSLMAPEEQLLEVGVGEAGPGRGDSVGSAEGCPWGTGGPHWVSGESL